MAGFIRFSKIVHIIKICKYFDKAALRNPPHAHSAKRWQQLYHKMKNLTIFFITLLLISCNYSKNPKFNKIINGQREGRWIILSKEGKVDAVLNYKNGLEEGIQIEYYSNGRIFEKDFRHQGKKFGQKIFYYKNGLYMRFEFYNNKHNLDSLNIQWFDNGNAEYFGFYKDDKMIGEWKQYYPEKKIFLKGNFNRNGKKEGIWDDFDESGIVTKKNTYNNGKIVKCITFKKIKEPKITQLSDLP